MTELKIKGADDSGDFKYGEDFIERQTDEKLLINAVIKTAKNS